MNYIYFTIQQSSRSLYRIRNVEEEYYRYRLLLIALDSLIWFQLLVCHLYIVRLLVSSSMHDLV